jgi:NADH dehydrogenase FAD-containing subunit
MARSKNQPKRVLVVGAGAAGMSCADALSNHTDRFEVTLIGTPLSLPLVL